MPVTELTETVTVTPTLTPIQEKTIFGVNVTKHFESVNSSGSEILDSTVAIVKKIDDGDVSMMHSWMEGKPITSQLDYAILLLVLSNYQNDHLGKNDLENINVDILNTLASVDLKALPKFSNILGWDKLDNISKCLSKTTFQNCSSMESFSKVFKSIVKSQTSFTSILYFYFAFNHLKSDGGELEKVSEQVKVFFEEEFKQLKFPTASQTNSREIDRLMDLAIYLTADRELNAYLDTHKTINKFIYVSYQNVKVMKLWCINSLNLGLYDKSRSTFRTYLNYIEDFKMKNNGEYQDCVDVIHTYIFVLEKLSCNIETFTQYNELKKWFAEVDGILNTFTGVTGTNTSVYLNCLRGEMARIYYSFAIIEENFLTMEFDAFSKIGNVINFLEKSVDALNCKDDTLKISKAEISEIHHKYSYYLHKSGEHKLALQHARRSMKNSPDKIKYINFYIKLLSGDEENNDTMLVILQQVIENLHSSVSGDENAKCRTIEWKRDALEAYLLFLTLLRDSAIDALAPFFGFVNTLFEDQPQDLNELRETGDRSKVAKRNVKTGATDSSVGDGDGCSPCTPSHIPISSSIATSSGSKERKLKSLLKPLKLKPSASNSTGKENALMPIMSNTSLGSRRQLGQSIRKSLQVNRLGSTKSKVAGHPATAQPSKGSSLTPLEAELLYVMWLTLSRIFQANGDNPTALQCVTEAENYVSHDPSNRNRNEIGILARKGSVLSCSGQDDDEDREEEGEPQHGAGGVPAGPGLGGTAKREIGRGCLLKALGLVEKCYGVGNDSGLPHNRIYPDAQLAGLGESIVAATQLLLASQDTVGIARCRKHLDRLVHGVAFGDSATCWLLLAEIHGGAPRDVAHEAGPHSARELAGDVAYDCVHRAVHGWHGLSVFSA